MNQQKTSKNMERTVSMVLQFGVLISAAMIILGCILFFTSGYHDQTSYHELTAPSYSFPHGLATLKTSVQAGDGLGFIELGVLLLILTPIPRVLISILLFKRQKDRPMTVVTLVVLLVLVGSFILGLVVK